MKKIFKKGIFAIGLLFIAMTMLTVPAGAATIKMTARHRAFLPTRTTAICPMPLRNMKNPTAEPINLT